MNKYLSRRNFIQNSSLLAVGASVVSPLIKEVTPLTSKPLNILILGGTSFLGPHQIAYALQRGHRVSTFTRGKTKPTVHGNLFDEVEMLVGDREDNLKALKNRKWDVVFDNSGRKVEWTRATAELLKDNVDKYVYISSVSAYYPYYTVDIKEDQELVMDIPANLESGEKQLYDYGVMKANSEKVALDIFGEKRTIVVRPTFMTGPGDRTDRFMYWPLQLAKGGDVIVPGQKNTPIQYIDIRDISKWMIRLIENAEHGNYNGAGPNPASTISDYVNAGSRAFDVEINPIRIDDSAFLESNNLPFIAPWILPSPKFKGISQANIDRALSTGLTFTPVDKTIRDTYDWWQSSAVSPERREKYSNDPMGVINRGPEIIKRWTKRMGK